MVDVRQSRQQWVFLNACGCAFGVMEYTGENTGEAWVAFYDQGHKTRTNKAVVEAMTKGVRVVRVSHETYVGSWLHNLRSDWVCPHDQ